MSLFSRVIFRNNSTTLCKNVSVILASKFHTCEGNFAGHSKWANIKHIKALKDGQKAAIFTKLSRQIRLAIQEGGSSNPSLNVSLQNTIDEALRKNMPMASIQNTIKKCEQNKTQLKKYILEIKALNKIFMVCILYTDNFAGFKMNLAPVIKKAGAVFTDAAHLFEDKGVVVVRVNEHIKSKAKSTTDLEEICTEDAIDCGAEEIEVLDYDNGIVNFLCNPIEMNRISGELTKKGYNVENAEHIFIPKLYASVSDDDLKSYEIFRNKLKNFEGIEEIYDNLEPVET